MTTWRQVLHVAGKDVRYSRRLLLVYAAAVALAAAGWLLGLDAFNTYSAVWGLGILGLAMVIAALLALEDSPARRDQLWTTLPLSAWSVFGAKLLTAAVTLAGVGLAAQALALTTFQLSAPEIAPILGRSLRIMAALLLFAMLMGALSADGRTLALLLTLVPLLYFLLGVFLAVIRDAQSAGALPRIGNLLLVPLLVVLLAYQYRTRRTRRTVIAAAGFAVALLSWPLLSGGRAATSAAALADEGAGASLRIEQLRPYPGLPQSLRLDLAVSAADSGVRYEVRFLRATLVRPDGTKDPVNLNRDAAVLVPGPQPGTEGLRFLNEVAPPWEQDGGQVSLNPTPEQRKAILEAGALVELTGTLAGLEPGAVRSIPVSSEDVVTRTGERTRILGLEAAAMGTAVRMETTNIGRTMNHPDAGWALGMTTPRVQYLLVHRSRGEVAAYEQQSGGGSLRLVVLPGAGAFRSELVLQPKRRYVGGHPAEPPRREWVEQAELVMVEWSERSTRLFRLQVSVTAAATPE